MKKHSDNLIEFDAIKREQIDEGVCKCGMKAKFLIDEKNMIVKCKNCNARVDPFKALLVITDRASKYNEQTRAMIKQREAVQSYKPHRITLKNLEKQYNKSSKGKANLGTKRYPCCPSCKEPFELDEIVDNWVGGIAIQQRLYSRQNKQQKDDT